MQRLKYLDVAKGILILIVVFHHIPQVASKLLFIDSDPLAMIDESDWLYSTFFMPSFFIITGYCSNFNANIKSFIWKNFKTLILSGVTLSIISCFIDFTLNFSFVYTIELKKVIWNFLFYGTHYWFLTVLFLDKVIYFIMGKFHFYDSIKGILCLSLMLLAVTIYPMIDENDRNNYWYYCHALFFLFFIFCGDFLRNYRFFDGKLLHLGLLYVPLTSVFCFMKYHPPVVTHKIGLQSCSEVPLCILFAIIGTLLIILLAKWVMFFFRNVTFIEYIGRISLIIYTIHIVVLTNVEKYVSLCSLSLDDFCGTILFVAITMFLSMIIILVVSKILDTPYLKWTTGKW